MGSRASQWFRAPHGGAPCVVTPSCVLALASPTAELTRAERRWAAMVFAAPMHSMPLEVCAAAKTGGVGTVFPRVGTTHVSAAIGFIQRTHVLGRLERWWDTAHSRDKVVLRWMGTQAMASRSLAPLLALRRRAQGEPTMANALAGTETPGAVALAVRRWLQALTPDDALRQRLLRAGLPVDEVTPSRSAALITALRRCIPRGMATAAIKVICNAAVTTRRMGERGAPSFLGWPCGENSRAHDSQCALPRHVAVAMFRKMEHWPARLVMAQTYLVGCAAGALLRGFV